MILTLGFTSALFMAAIVLSAKDGTRTLFMASVVVFAAVLMPFNLTHHGGAPHVGIAPSFPIVSLVLVAVIVGILVTLGSRGGFARWSICIPLGAILFGAIFLWPPEAQVFSGILQVSLGLLAWGTGSAMGSSLLDRSIRRAAFARLLVAVSAIQLIVVGAQALGLPINSMSETQVKVVGDRLNGMLDHPNTLGKAALLVLFLYMVVRGARFLSEFLDFVMLGLTGALCVAAEGRTTLFGLVLLVTGWLLLSRKADGPALGRRQIAFVGSLGLVAVAGVVISSRFSTDVYAGSRSRLLDIAFEAISRDPWSGVGPNLYVREVGRYSELVASGVPVHNSVVLSWAEFGVPVGTLIWLPFVVLLWRSLRFWRLHRTAERATVIAMVIPMVAVVVTGWGALAGSTWVLIGFCGGMAQRAVEMADASSGGVLDGRGSTVRGRSQSRIGAGHVG